VVVLVQRDEAWQRPCWPLTAVVQDSADALVSSPRSCRRASRMCPHRPGGRSQIATTGCLGNLGYQRGKVYSGLTLAALMIGHHLSISDC
jgi:hypothetical protein